MIDLRIFCIEITLDDKRYFLVIKKRINRLEVISAFRIKENEFFDEPLESIDFKYVNRTPFTFKNVVWALGRNLKKFFKGLFAKEMDIYGQDM